LRMWGDEGEHIERIHPLTPRLSVQNRHRVRAEYTPDNRKNESDIKC